MKTQGDATARRSRAPYLLLAAVVVHVLVWVGWLTFAGFHPVASVPLAR